MSDYLTTIIFPALWKNEESEQTQTEIQECNWVWQDAEGTRHKQMVREEEKQSCMEVYDKA